jgi:precorrin-2 methylase
MQKIKILEEISTSDEARSIGATVPGLSSALRWQSLASVPLIGGIAKVLFKIEGDSTLETRLRSIEQLPYLLIESANARFDRVEQDIRELRNIIISSEMYDEPNKRKVENTKTTTFKKTPGKEIPIIKHESANSLMGRASEIYSALKKQYQEKGGEEL